MYIMYNIIGCIPEGSDGESAAKGFACQKPSENQETVHVACVGWVSFLHTSQIFLHSKITGAEAKGLITPAKDQIFLESRQGYTLHGRAYYQCRHAMRFGLSVEASIMSNAKLTR
ncbi:hypothetical protein GH714_032785 [Hevea brasiliensis]|uniref:Uncharacterized protein n=1 Tax=Hevea brasiliensis TaxID=3981 RepID=A0A6A6NC30_HEVBR|nr:hypothetical protein GH714_032785 [Hevea brasiliensis]